MDGKQAVEQSGGSEPTSLKTENLNNA